MDSNLSLFCRIRKELKYMTARQAKTLYVGWDGKENLGDEILRTAIQSLLSSSCIFYPMPYIGRFQYLTGLGRPRIGLLGGGTLINMPSYLSRCVGNYEKRIVFGTGVAMPEFWDHIDGYSGIQDKWIDYLNSSSYIGLRGPLSQQQLEDWGINVPHKIIGDPAVYFADKTIHKKNRQKVLGVNAGATRNLLWGGSDKKLWHSIRSVLLALDKRGWTFVLFPVTPRDLEFVTFVQAQLGPDKVRVVSKFLDMEIFMREARQVDVFLGEKLHASILSICTNTPTVMIEYRPKCRDFAMSLGIEDRIVRSDQLTTSLLIDMIETVFDDIESEQDRLHSATRKLKLKLETAAKEVQEILRG